MNGQFFLKNFWNNKFQNIFMILQLSIVILLLNSLISNVAYSEKVNNYISNKKDTFCLLSGAIANTVGNNNDDGFTGLVEMLSNINGVKGVGYQIEESVIVDKVPDQIVSTYFLNSTMSELKYPLSAGSWFKQTNDNEIEIIIGGELTRKYNVGDHVDMKRATYKTGTLSYDTINAKIVGKLRNPALIINLNFSSNKPTFTNLFDPYDNVVLSNNTKILDPHTTYYPLQSVIIQTDNDSKSETKDALSQYGQVFSFQDIEKISIDLFHDKIQEILLPFIVLLTTIIFGLIGSTFLFVYKYMKDLSIYNICGMSRGRLCLLVFSQSLIDTVLAVFVSIFISIFPLINEILFQRTSIGFYNIGGSLILIAILLAITLLYSWKLTNKTSVGLLRRYE